ncbi:MAG: outer membrane beta-barrel protein [Candidatus Polarisedimenticolia bacterium]
MMKRRGRNAPFACVLCAALGAAPATAGTTYLGASAGRTSVDASAGIESFDAGATAYKVYGGTRLLKLLGVEGGYFDLGNADDASGGTTFDTEITGWEVFAVGVLPLPGPLELFGKYGLVRADVNTRLSGSINLSGSDTDWDTAYGFGAAWSLKFLAIRLEWERFDLSGSDRQELLSAGIEIRF